MCKHVQFLEPDDCQDCTLRNQWVLWVWEGSWRVLACYDKRQDGERALRECDNDGQNARLLKRGTPLDKAIRADVHNVNL